MNTTAKTPIVLIHGLWMTPKSWDTWAERFRAAGHDVIVPGWPGIDDRAVEDIRNNPEPLKGIGLKQIADNYERIIRALPEKPIIIGHSFGGLLTQLMVQRDLAAAAVAIDSVPAQGVLTLKWSFIRSLWPVLNPFIPASRPYYMPFDHFQYSFANDLPLEEQRAGYDRDIVPESRRLARGALSRAARVDFQRPHAPLLMIAGEKDHIMPPSVNRSNAKHWAKSPAITEYVEFPGRSHWICAEPGWEEVADHALDWALAHTRAGAVRTA